MNDTSSRAAAFSAKWLGRGYEKGADKNFMHRHGPGDCGTPVQSLCPNHAAMTACNNRQEACGEPQRLSAEK